MFWMAKKANKEEKYIVLGNTFEDKGKDEVIWKIIKK